MFGNLLLRKPFCSKPSAIKPTANRRKNQQNDHWFPSDALLNNLFETSRAQKANYQANRNKREAEKAPRNAVSHKPVSRPIHVASLYYFFCCCLRL
jgi:hypothetical protein